jgi:hypothetical protein
VLGKLHTHRRGPPQGRVQGEQTDLGAPDPIGNLLNDAFGMFTRRRFQ